MDSVWTYHIKVNGSITKFDVYEVEGENDKEDIAAALNDLAEIDPGELENWPRPEVVSMWSKDVKMENPTAEHVLGMLHQLIAILVKEADTDLRRGITLDDKEVIRKLDVRRMRISIVLGDK